MAIATWAVEVKDKNSLNKMIDKVQKGEIEEIFLCQIAEDDAVIKGLKKGDLITIVSIKDNKLKTPLSKLGKNVLLDDLDDSYFDIDDEGAALKGVIYPESEDDELKMLEGLA